MPSGQRENKGGLLLREDLRRTNGKILGAGNHGIGKAEVKQGLQSGLFVGTCQVALNCSGDISVAEHTSVVPIKECTQLGAQTGGIRSLWAVLEL